MCRVSQGLIPTMMNIKFGFLDQENIKVSFEHDLWAMFEELADVSCEKILRRIFSSYTGNSCGLIEVMKSGFSSQT
jgi:hypothetical protein